MFKKNFNCKRLPKKNPKYITRSVTFRKFKAPGVKVQQLSYLKKPKIFDPCYSIPLRFKKPGKLDWWTPRGKNFVLFCEYIPIPSVITLKFPKEFVPFSDIEEKEDNKESILGF